MEQTDFEALLSQNIGRLERLVNCKLPTKADAQDVLQEVYLAAFLRFDTLKNPDAFLPWFLQIARNKCRDFYRARAARPLIFLEEPENRPAPGHLTQSRLGLLEETPVSETLGQLSENEQQILRLFYFDELPQSEIAALLGIPLGTVKSRLYAAKQHFKQHYPAPPALPAPKGAICMLSKFPETMPAYTVRRMDQPPFPVRWEELMGWFLVPKLGERLSWAMYDFPERKHSEVTQMEVVGKALVHGIEGVEIHCRAFAPMEANAIAGQDPVERRFVAQLTDTHCRILAESHTENGVRHYYTFLDGGDFLANWGFGQDNCGKEIHLAPKGLIRRNGAEITCEKIPEMLDVVGRYEVTVNGKAYDTVCVLDIELYNNVVASEQFIDRNGKTVLWRRFNRDDWAISRYKTPWTKRFPENERLVINGETYVHWYDCLTDYVL